MGGGGYPELAGFSRGIGIDGILLSPAYFREDCAFADHVLKQRIVIEHEHRTRIRQQALFEVSDQASHARLWQWIE